MHCDEPPNDNADAVLVNQEMLARALAAVAGETPAKGFSFIETEPLLSAFCRTELLQILGKLAMSGASSRVVRGVGVDIHRLIAVTAIAMKSGYSSLLEDFLPEFAAYEAETDTESEGDG